MAVIRNHQNDVKNSTDASACEYDVVDKIDLCKVIMIKEIS
jgi:hypothetical protein